MKQFVIRFTNDKRYKYKIVEASTKPLARKMAKKIAEENNWVIRDIDVLWEKPLREILNERKS